MYNNNCNYLCNISKEHFPLKRFIVLHISDSSSEKRITMKRKHVVRVIFLEEKEN